MNTQNLYSEELLHILQCQLKDNVKASVLQPDGTYEKVDRRGKQRFNSQGSFCAEAREKEKAVSEAPVGVTRTFIPETSHEK